MAAKILTNLKYLHRNRLNVSGSFSISNYLFFKRHNSIFKTYTKNGKFNYSADSAENIRKVCAIVAALCGVGLHLFSDRFRFLANLFPSVYADYIIPNEGGSLRERFNFIADVVEKTANSVVYIEIHELHGRRVDLFHGRSFSTSNGSGFIVQEDGLILTNAHVVIRRPNSIVEVKLRDGRSYNGVVEDVDETSDLATVRIKANNLPVMPLGSSANLRPGEFVVAIGSPLSLSNTITAGVVSSPHRQSKELGLRGKDIEYIQTDASITFGNSGGPLVNLDGEAIGINSMKVTPGISFAIPIDFAKNFLRKSEEKRKKIGVKTPDVNLRKRYIGITMLTLTPELLHEMHNKNQSIPPNVQGGVLVWRVILGSPAHLSGLRTGDIVTHINSEPIDDVAKVYKALETGKPISLRVFRGEMELKMTVTPEEVS